MLISAGTITRDAADRDTLTTPSHEICWRGFVYKRGSRAGAESLRELSQAREEDIPRMAAELKGTYFIAVHCKASGNIFAFVDQAGLCHSFYSKHRIGTSFLEISRLEGFTGADIDPEALVEFFHFGCIYEERTFFPEIRKIEPDAVLCCDPKGNIGSLRKPVADISEPPQRSFDSLMRDFALAVKDEKVSVDVTGGADSRLLASALAYYGLPFETATSGRPGFADVEIGARLAKVLGRDFHPTYHVPNGSDWEELFFRSDGMFDVTKSHRATQLQHDRKKRGMTMSVSGAAGEAFRETWWLHDFPFYNRRNARLDRLYNLRMAPQPLLHGLLADRYRKVSLNQRENLLRRVSKYVVPGNTRTYDRIYYYFQLRTWGGTFATSNMSVLKVGIPYVDRDFVRIGYNLPRTQRMLSRFNRKMITKYCRKAAFLPSTEAGVSLASGPLALSLDLNRYLADRTKRLAKKIGQQVLGKTFFQESPDDPGIYDDLLRTMDLRGSTQVLADSGVLSQSLDPRLLPKRYLGHVFVLGRFFEQLGESVRPESARAGAARNVRPDPFPYGIASRIRVAG